MVRAAHQVRAQRMSLPTAGPSAPNLPIAAIRTRTGPTCGLCARSAMPSEIDRQGSRHDPPERFAGGEVVAAARCPVDVSTYPRRHVIVVKHAAERQTFSVHEVAH